MDTGAEQPERLFLAVRPPRSVREELAEIVDPEDQAVRWVAPTEWHITLRFLGRAYPSPVMAAIDRIGALPPAQVELGPRIRRLGRSAIVVPAAGLDELAAELLEATRELGEEADDRPFHGHLTLGRQRKGARRSPLVGRRVTFAFPAAEVELVSSRLTDSGPVYSTLRTWPVGD